MSIHEKQYFAVSLLAGEIYNGGFDQYFHNSSGDYYNDAEQGLARMGKGNLVHLLQAAGKVAFGHARVPFNEEDRWSEFKPQGESSALDLLDSQFAIHLEYLYQALERFALAEGLVQMPDR